MKVKVEYLGFIRNLLKRREEEVELSIGSALSDLLDKLAEGYGEPFRREVYEPGCDDVKTGFVATVNGVLIGQLNGVKTRLSSGDVVTLMSLMSGG